MGYYFLSRSTNYARKITLFAHDQKTYGNVKVLTDVIFNKRLMFIIIINYHNNINQIVIDLAGTYILT